MKKSNDIKYISGICAKENKKGNLMLKSSKLEIPIYRIYDMTKNSFEWVIENLTDDIQNGKVNCLIINDLKELLTEKAALEVFIKEVVIKSNIRLIILDKELDIFPEYFHIDIERIYEDKYKILVENDMD